MSRPRQGQFLLWGLLAWSSIGMAAPAKLPTPPIPPQVKPALAAITAQNLKADLSFLASDALGGRYAPSPGLDVAAEFIASQFRAAGLEPVGDHDYFQTAKMVDRRMLNARSDLTAIAGEKRFTVAKASVQVISSTSAKHLERVPALVFASKDATALQGVDLKGKAVIAPNFTRGSVPESELPAAYAKSQEFDEAVRNGKAALEVLVGKPRGGRTRSRLIDAQNATAEQTPVVLAESDDLKNWLDHANDDRGNRFLTFDVPAPEDRPAILKNVIGVLRGSDPKLKDSYVLVTAHYDHIGMADTGADLSPQGKKEGPDTIYNGANDDGSGTVSVIEIARGLSKLGVHPKRTLVFMTFFGEERGDIGSLYYAQHPIFPLAKTVADLNLEQVGRTDSTEGKQVSNASVTGFDYSSVTRYLQNAGRQVGVTVYLNKEASDAYFERSDNAALAEAGVPAHTLCVAFDYPDYHGLGDEWNKIDYDNMAKVDRAVALSLWTMANSLEAPSWNAGNPKTAEYRKTQQKLKTGN